MIEALTWAVENPLTANRTLDVPAILKTRPASTGLARGTPPM